MKSAIIFLALASMVMTACMDKSDQNKTSINPTMIMNDSIVSKTGYSDVNGIKMYYEIYGEGKPLVLIHGGGSTIETSFARIIPLLAKHYKVIAVELQNHGRSGHRNVPETFEQDADDVAALLKNIAIEKASFLGFSNGGTTAMQIAIRHPEIVEKLVLAAAAYKRDGFPPGFFEMMQGAKIASMPQELKDAFLKVNPDSAKLQNMFEKDRDRMIGFKDMDKEQLRSIKAPALVINGDADVINTEQALEISRLIPHSQLAILPGGHGKYIGEIATRTDDNRDVEFVVEMILVFLEKHNNNN